ncbi:MAG TPA: TolC family protein, partial [Chitinivibrionales bacterium]
MGKKQFCTAASFFFMSVLFSGLCIAAQPLSLQSYIAITLKNNPQTRIASASVRSSAADRQAAFSQLLPNVSGSAGISTGASMLSGGTDQNSASVGLNANALLFDFGKTPYQYRSSVKKLDAALIDSQSTIAVLILNARTAYFSYLQSIELLKVSQDALNQITAHLDQAKTLFEVGKQARITITKAQVDVANAEVSLIHAQNAVKLAAIQLNVVAGVPVGDSLVLTDSLSAREDSIGLIDAQNLALSQRPELRSAQARIEAAKLQRSAARAAYLPSINATGNLGWTAITGSDFNTSADWTIGANLTVPIYKGGAIDASIHNADASLLNLQAQADATTQSIVQQVQ